MMKTVLSIIIPMYNAEAYIIEAIESALKDADDSLEIIVVDDGSTDNSYKRCKEFKDDRIRLLRQKNSGAPSARNKGLCEARGEYVIFFDADDFFAEGAIKRILTEIKKETHDCYIGNFYRYDGKVSKLEYKNLQWISSLYDYYMFTPSPNTKVFKKSVLIDNSIVFENIRLAQDLNFYLKFLGISQDIKIIDYPFFHYRHVDNSISHITDDRILDIGKSVSCAIAYYDKHNVINDCYAYAYLAGIKHTNYQLYKLVYVEDYAIIDTLFPVIKSIWDSFFSKAEIKPFDIKYYTKKWIDAIIQYYYRLCVYKKREQLEKVEMK